jgi:hypothetical protein
VRLRFAARPYMSAAPSASVRGSKRALRLRDVRAVDAAARKAARWGTTAGPRGLALRERVWKEVKAAARSRTLSASCWHRKAPLASVRKFFFLFPWRSRRRSRDEWGRARLMADSVSSGRAREIRWMKRAGTAPVGRSRSTRLRSTGGFRKV